MKIITEIIAQKKCICKPHCCNKKRVSVPVVKKRARKRSISGEGKVSSSPVKKVSEKVSEKGGWGKEVVGSV